MNGMWLLWLACEGPVALPPKAHQSAPSNARMVQMATFRGFLQQPLRSMKSVAVLKIVDTLDDDERATAKAFPHQVVLIIEREQDAHAALEYLRGLSGIASVKTVCSEPCPPLKAAQ